MPLSSNHRPTQRIMDILTLLANNKNTGMTLTEIARFLNCPKSTLAPMLHTLALGNFLIFDENTFRYSIGAKLYEIGSNYVQGLSSIDLLLEEMQNIVDACSESCHMAELLGSRILYLYKIDSPQSIRMFSSPGKTLPANSTALGKALLSFYNREKIHALFPNGLPQVTDKTICDFDELMEQLQQVQQTGFAYECEENSDFIRCIAVPILKAGRPYRALSVSIPTFRFTDKKGKHIEELLVSAKKRLETIFSLEEDS